MTRTAVRRGCGEEGFVLILTLVVLAFVTAALLRAHGAVEGAVAVMGRSLDALAAREAARSALDLAAAALDEDDPGIDHLGETWAQGLALELDGGRSVLATLDDSGARFPIESLVGPEGVDREALARLRCVARRLGADAAQEGELVGEIEELVRIRREGRIRERLLAPEEVPALAERPAAPPPGRPATPLARHVTVLGGTRINVNTAPLDLLACVDRSLGERWARQVVEERSRQPFASLSELAERIPDTEGAEGDLRRLLDVRSRAFHLDVTLRWEGGALGLDAWFERRGRSVVRRARWRERLR